MPALSPSRHVAEANPSDPVTARNWYSLLKKKTFAPAQPDCHAELAGGTKTVLGRPPEETMKTWAQTFLK